MIATESQRRPSEAEELTALACLSCGSRGADVLVVEFAGIPCDCDLLPFTHPHKEAVCGDCRRMLTVARARVLLWRARN